MTTSAAVRVPTDRQPTSSDRRPAASRGGAHDHRPRPGRVELVGRVWGAPMGADLPDAVRWSGWFAVALAEAVLGRRPATQLAGWVSAEVLAGLHRRQRLRPAHRPAPRTVLLSGRVQHPADRTAEASAVLRSGTRLLVLAFRLEGEDGRWRCTALDAGLSPVRRRAAAPPGGVSSSATAAG